MTDFNISITRNQNVYLSYASFDYIIFLWFCIVFRYVCIRSGAHKSVRNVLTLIIQRAENIKMSHTKFSYLAVVGSYIFFNNDVS